MVLHVPWIPTKQLSDGLSIFKIHVLKRKIKIYFKNISKYIVVGIYSNLKWILLVSYIHRLARMQHFQQNLNKASTTSTAHQPALTLIHTKSNPAMTLAFYVFFTYSRITHEQNHFVLFCLLFPLVLSLTFFHGFAHSSSSF